MIAVSIKFLRRQCPRYEWRAEHHGMGYQYIGTRHISPKHVRIVRVYAEARLCGPSEDDFATVWMVDDGSRRESLSSWAYK